MNCRHIEVLLRIKQQVSKELNFTASKLSFISKFKERTFADVSSVCHSFLLKIADRKYDINRLGEIATYYDTKIIRDLDIVATNNFCGTPFRIKNKINHALISIGVVLKNRVSTSGLKVVYV
jgi:hypothetical protein